jgi:NAD(P)-dependent dehydrogenase (short-subunit alcohol dehydrogenase family)
MPRYDSLRERVVLVTGAAGGLGSELVRMFSAQGASVFATDRDGSGLETVRASLNGSEGIIATLVANLEEPSVPGGLVEAVLGRFGQLDVLVNNAADLASCSIATLTADEFDRIVSVNLRAPYFLMRAATEVMNRQEQGGRIVNVASIDARHGGGSADTIPYAACKGGVVAMTKGFAKFVANPSVLINAVLPGGIDTPMIADWPPEGLAEGRRKIPLGRLASPAEIAELILWLSSGDNSYSSGASFDINGGLAMS